MTEKKLEEKIFLIVWSSRKVYEKMKAEGKGIVIPTGVFIELTKEVEFKIYNKIRKKYPNLNRQELSLVVELVFEELKKLERI